MNYENYSSTIDAYKSIIDFNKTIITISTSVLTALIAYMIYQNIHINTLNYISICLIVFAIFFSLFGFGGAIQTIKDGQSRPSAIFVSNISGIILISGIVLTLFAHKYGQEKSIDEILNTIENSTTTLNQKLLVKTMKSLNYNNYKYTIIYKIDKIEHKVVYDEKSSRIITIKYQIESEE